MLTSERDWFGGKVFEGIYLPYIIANITECQHLTYSTFIVNCLTERTMGDGHVTIIQKDHIKEKSVLTKKCNKRDLAKKDARKVEH